MNHRSIPALLGLALLFAAPTTLAQTPSTGPSGGEAAPAVPAAEPAETGPSALSDAQLARDGLAPEGVYEATFRDHLYQTQPIMLQGIIAERYIDFHIPSTWELTGPVEFEIGIEHSETLLPRMSAMTLMVNNRAVGSAFLDETNDREGRLIARVDPSQLSDFNQIRIAVVQHYTTDCEDPFDPSLWTRVSEDSILRIPYRRKPVEVDLVQLPGPFVEKHALGASIVDLVVPGRPSAPTLDALAVVGFGLGRLADYRTVEVDQTVTDVRTAKRHALLVGLLDENPQIKELLGGVEPGAEEGLVAIARNPADPSLAVLIVTARDAIGLRKAAMAVAGDDRHEVLSGPAAVIKDFKEAWPATQRSPKPAPASENVRLADLGIEDRTVRGFYADPIVVPLHLEGDANLQPDGGTFTLEYNYSAQLDSKLSTVEVSVNGVVLASQGLTDPKGRQGEKLVVQLPAELVTPVSKVIVQFHLFPINFNPCERVSDRIIWGTVKESSSFYLPRDHFAEMPDLGRLKYDLWPFTTDGGDDGAVTIVAPDAPSPTDAEAVFVTASALGWKRAEPLPALKATTGDQYGGALQRENLILLVAPDAPNAVYAALNDRGDLARTFADGEWKLKGADVELLGARFNETYGSLEEIVNASAPQSNAILVVRSNTRSQLPALAGTLLDDETLARLDGNLTVVPSGEVGDLRIDDEAAKVMFGSKPMNSRVTGLLQRYYAAFGILLFGAAVFISLAMNLWSRRNGART